MPARLFRAHDAAAQAAYQELKQLARSQRRVLAGTPGTLKQRTQSGKQYWVREYIRVDGRKVDEYLGAEKSLGKARLDLIAREIELARALAAGSAKLRLLGFQRIDRKPAAVLEVFFNHGLHEAGLTLVGSHAFGALLNELGVRAPRYKISDIDLAKTQRPAVAVSEGIAVDRLPASFKLPAADLLVPGTQAGKVVEVRELRAHAQAIPLLDFLIAEAIDGVVLSPNQVIPVKLPSPERFALHKLFSSQSRRTDRDKIRKDLEQAVVLAGALEEQTPETLWQAFRAMPKEGKDKVKRGARAAAAAIAGRHEAGERALRRIAR